MAGVIVTGVDETETSLEAAEKAASLAAALGSELHVVTAFNVNMAETIQSVRGEPRVEEKGSAYQRVVTKHADEAERTVTSNVNTLREKFPDVSIVAKSVEGSPGSALVQEAEEAKADIIVVGNRRVQGPSRILGSVARSVAAQATCDLYVVYTHHR